MNPLIEKLAEDRLEAISGELTALEYEAEELMELLSEDEDEFDCEDCDCEEIEEDSGMSEEDKEIITDIMKKYI